MTASRKGKPKKSTAQVLSEAKENLTKRGEPIPTGDGADRAILNRDRFIRLATPRTRKAVGSVVNLGRLFGAGYTSTPEERQRIMDALIGAVQDVDRKSKGEKADAEAFTL